MAQDSEQIKKGIVNQLYWDHSVDASNVMVEIARYTARVVAVVNDLDIRPPEQ